MPTTLSHLPRTRVPAQAQDLHHQVGEGEKEATSSKPPPQATLTTTVVKVEQDSKEAVLGEAANNMEQLEERVEEGLINHLKQICRESETSGTL